MKLKTCSNCGKVIGTEISICKSCGANYCSNCSKLSTKTCLFCGQPRDDGKNFK